ncbi:MAG TPA: sugar-binding protein [Labilithrix sp.]
MRPLRVFFASTLAASVAAVAACGIDALGVELSPADDAGAPPPAPPPPPPPPGDDDAGNDAARDAGSDAASCDAQEATFLAPTLHIHPATVPVTVDGDLSEWACAKFFAFDKTNAGVIHLDASTPNTYSFAVAYDANKIYIAVRATDAPPLLGDVTPDVYNNDAIELFLGGDSTFDGGYSAIDHQYVVDWKNRRAEYRNGPVLTPSAAFVSAVKTNATGYVLEASIAASEVGKATFASGAKLGWGIAGDNSNGTAQDTWMDWFEPSVTCTGCCSIYCDTRYYATLAFDP